jgi:hypothetical protein
MAKSAVLLVDDALQVYPIRQWVSLQITATFERKTQQNQARLNRSGMWFILIIFIVAVLLT